MSTNQSYRRPPQKQRGAAVRPLRCGECGDYMRPKLTNRRTADGELIYTTMCSARSADHGTVCTMKNCNGNTLDAKIIEEIRKLSADKETLTRLLAQTKEGHQWRAGGLRRRACAAGKTHRNGGGRIKRLVESLSVASETSAKYVMEQIDALHRESETQQARLSSWKPSSPNRAGCSMRSLPSIRK